MAVFETFEDATEFAKLWDMDRQTPVFSTKPIHFVAWNKETGESFWGDFGFEEMTVEVEDNDLVIVVDSNGEKITFRKSEHECELTSNYSMTKFV